MAKGKCDATTTVLHCGDGFFSVLSSLGVLLNVALCDVAKQRPDLKSRVFFVTLGVNSYTIG